MASTFEHSQLAYLSHLHFKPPQDVVHGVFLDADVDFWQLPEEVVVEVAQFDPSAHEFLAGSLVVLFVLFDLLIVVLLPGLVHLLPVGGSHPHAEVVDANGYEGEVEVEAEDESRPAHSVK